MKNIQNSLQENIQKKNFQKFQMSEQDARYKKILEELLPLKKGKLLEVGCASGNFLQLLKEQGWECYGLDIMPRLVKESREKGLNVKLANVQEEIPFNEKFDVIIAGEIIEHMIHVDKFLEICDNHLNENGTIFITTPNLVFWVNRLLMLIGKEPLFAYAEYHYDMFIWKDLNQRISKHFNVQRLRGSHILLSTRRHKVFKIFEILADYLPTYSAHFVIIAKKKKEKRL